MARSTSERFTVEDLQALSGLREVAAIARGAGFNMVLGLGGARTAQLTRDRDRALRRGDAARAAELSTLLGRQGRLDTELAAQAEREADVPREVKSKDAVYRGRVTDGRKGRPGLTVQLMDASGEIISEDETGPRGAFTLAHAPSEGKLAIRVADPKGRIFLSKGPLRPLAEGEAAYLEIPVDGLEPRTPPRRPPRGGEPEKVIVPSVTGLALEEARKALKEAGLAGRKAGEEAAPDRAGRVLKQDPPAGQAAAPGTTVALIVGAPEQRGFPDLRGSTLKAADAKIRDMNLRRDTVALVHDKDRAGTVVGHVPEPDGAFTPDTRVLLRVATGEDKADVTTAIVLFGLDPRTESLGISEATLRNRLKAAEVNSAEALRKLAGSGARQFAQRTGIAEERTARTVHAVLGEIARKFPEAG